VVEADPHDAKLLESRQIAENLHRRHLPGAERDALVARMVELRTPELGESALKPLKTTKADVIASVAAEIKRTPKSVARSVERTLALERTPEPPDEKDPWLNEPADDAVNKAIKMARDGPVRPWTDKGDAAVDHDGTEIPEHLRAYWSRMYADCNEVNRLLLRAQSILSKLGNDLPTLTGREGGDSHHAEWQHAYEQVHSAAYSVRSWVPVLVCPGCGGDREAQQTCGTCRGDGVVGAQGVDAAKTMAGAVGLVGKLRL